MGWKRDLLKRIGAPATRQNLEFLATWQRWEGGHTNNDARFNWLNTTQKSPGAVRKINSVGVLAFDTYANGINATANTLNNGRYKDIVQSLRTGDPYKNRPMAGLSTWLTGQANAQAGIAYANRVLGAPARGSSSVSVREGGQTYGRGGGASPQQVAAQAGAGPDELFQRALSGFMLGRAQARREGRDPQGGLGELAQLRAQYQAMGGVPERPTTAAPNIGNAQGQVLSDVQDGQPVTRKGGVREAFYDPIGAYDEGRWIHPIGGHSDHVHLSFDNPRVAMAAIRKAQQMGLRTTENPWAEGSAVERGVHTPTSYHYQTFDGQYGGGRSPILGKGLDVSGDAGAMANYFRWVRKSYL